MGPFKYVRHHRRSLILAGVVIVLLTFLFKEILREGSKDRLAHLRDAENSLTEAGQRAAMVRQIIRSTHDDGETGEIDPLGTPIPKRITTFDLWKSVERATNTNLNVGYEEVRDAGMGVPHGEKLDQRERILDVELSDLSAAKHNLEVLIPHGNDQTKSTLATKQQRTAVIDYEGFYEGVAEELAGYEGLVEVKTSMRLVKRKITTGFTQT
jgi:hypothetical protein